MIKVELISSNFEKNRISQDENSANYLSDDKPNQS